MSEEFKSVADQRAWLRKRHAACQDRLMALKAKPGVRTEDEKYRLEGLIESCQFFERELEQLPKI